ncbi:hypothetical protein [Acetobacter persici]|uniref:hypothetical protein n=1 Tax=Acetobacter persici TaxID=1076596 RepID=UPI001FCB9899|nr:hypothetical protein [Acetobacter persici]
MVLTSGQDVLALEARIRGIAPDNPGAVLVWAAVSGLLPVEDMALYESTILKRLSGAVACLRLTGAPHLSAGTEDLDRFGAGGAVRAAAEQLLARSAAGVLRGSLRRMPCNGCFCSGRRWEHRQDDPDGRTD